MLSHQVLRSENEAKGAAWIFFSHPAVGGILSFLQNMWEEWKKEWKSMFFTLFHQKNVPVITKGVVFVSFGISLAREANKWRKQRHCRNRIGFWWSSCESSELYLYWKELLKNLYNNKSTQWFTKHEWSMSIHK